MGIGYVTVQVDGIGLAIGPPARGSRLLAVGAAAVSTAKAESRIVEAEVSILIDFVGYRLRMRRKDEKICRADA